MKHFVLLGRRTHTSIWTTKFSNTIYDAIWTDVPASLQHIIFMWWALLATLFLKLSNLLPLSLLKHHQFNLIVSSEYYRAESILMALNHCMDVGVPITEDLDSIREHDDCHIARLTRRRAALRRWLVCCSSFLSSWSRFSSGPVFPSWLSN